MVSRVRIELTTFGLRIRCYYQTELPAPNTGARVQIARGLDLEFGAPGRDRTADARYFTPALYRKLSYRGSALFQPSRIAAAGLGKACPGFASFDIGYVRSVYSEFVCNALLRMTFTE